MNAGHLALGQRAIAGAERVMWGRDSDTGAAVAVVVHTSRLGPAVGGCLHLPQGDSAGAVAAAMARAELVTMAAVTGAAPMGGGAVVILGRADEAALATAAAMIDDLDGALWVVPDLGDDPRVGRAVAARTRFNADPDPRDTAGGIVRAAADAWRAETDADAAGLAGVHVAVLGVGGLARAAAETATQAGARVDRVRGGSAPLPTCDIIINCGTRRFAPEGPQGVRCRVLVGTIGGPLDDERVWRSLTAQGIASVPGSVAAGVLLRSAAETIAAREAAVGGDADHDGG